MDARPNPLTVVQPPSSRPLAADARVASHKATSPGVASPAAILVHVGSSTDSDALVRLAVELAESFGAALVGVGAAPGSVDHGPGSVAELEATRLILDGEAERFEALTAEVRAGVVWRAGLDGPGLTLERSGWAADLIMVNVRAAGGSSDDRPELRTLVVHSGRPVLVRTTGAKRTRFEHVVVLWDRSPACARALSAALPFLAGAERVQILTSASRRADGRSAEWVRDGLRQRGMAVEAATRPQLFGGRLVTTPADELADLVVMAGWPRPAWLRALDPTDARVAALTGCALLCH